MMHRSALPVLETARLRLCPLGAGDAALYCRIYTDPELMHRVGASLDAPDAMASFLAALGPTAAATAARRFWVVRAKASASALGLVGLARTDAPAAMSAELGVMLLRRWQQRGFATEAIARLVEHAFTALSVRLLCASHHAENTAMAGVLSKLGFLRCSIDDSGEPPWRWELARDDWQAGTLPVGSTVSRTGG